MKKFIVALMLFVAFMPVAYADVPTREEVSVQQSLSLDEFEKKLLTDEFIRKFEVTEKVFNDPNEDFSTKCLREYFELFYKDREKIMKMLEEQNCREDFLEFAKKRPDRAFMFLRIMHIEIIYAVAAKRPDEDFDSLVLMKVTEFIKIGHGTRYFDKPEFEVTEHEKKMREVADDLTVKDLAAYKLYVHTMENYAEIINMVITPVLGY